MIQDVSISAVQSNRKLEYIEIYKEINYSYQFQKRIQRVLYAEEQIKDCYCSEGKLGCARNGIPEF